MAIGTLNEWEREDLDDWGSMPKDLRRDLGMVIDLLSDADKVLEDLERGGYKQRAASGRLAAHPPFFTPDPERLHEYVLDEFRQFEDTSTGLTLSVSTNPSDRRAPGAVTLEFASVGDRVGVQAIVSAGDGTDSFWDEINAWHELEKFVNMVLQRANLHKRSSRRASDEDGYLVSVTYETWTPEDIEFGETNDRGYEVEDEWFPSLDELDSDSFIRQRQWLGWSDSTPSARSWIYSDDEVDYRTGERTQYHLFVERADGQPLSKEELSELGRELGVR